MNHIGHKIKYYRLNKGLTQSELANGIISFSYLSKIENGNTTPASDIIRLLCKKLDISPNVITEFEVSLQECKEWFRSLLLGDRAKSRKLFEEITRNSKIFSNVSLVNLIEIHKLRFYVLTKQADKATQQKRLLEQKMKKFNSLEKYYHLKFSGNYYFATNSYHKAYEMFQKAEELISKELYFKEEEENELYYLIGLTASKVRHVHNALIYTSKALVYYQSQYNLNKCGQCHILLGISYRRIDQLEKAKQNYEKALNIGESLKNNKLVSLSFQNIGALYSSIGDSQSAIKYFRKNYETLLGLDSVPLLVPIASIMKEYYKIKDYTNASYWLQQGLTLINNSLNAEDSIYIFDFKVYEQLLSKENSNKLEKIILTTIFPFLERNKLDYHKHIYSTILADYYYKLRKYKSAADYYTQANQILKSIYNE